MTSIHFAYPYLLLVAIPLIGLSLIPHFLVSKKYRRTRNRICALVLHCATILLATFALSGITFVHSISNTANELILVVDMSDSQQETADNRDGFVNDILKESVYQNFTVGVVTFGLDQVYAVPLTQDAGSAYNKYKAAELPDTSATDIDAALDYARTLFTNPQSGKMVLITDGKETDGSVISSATIGAAVAQGIKLDAVYISSEFTGKEFQLYNVAVPDVRIRAGVEYTIEASVYSKESGSVRVNLYDNGEHVNLISENGETNELVVQLAEGMQIIPLTYKFAKDGIHEIKVELVSVENGAEDGIGSNNVYFTYANLVAFKKVLIIENYANDSNALKDVLRDEMLGEDEEYDVSIFNLGSETLLHYVEDEPLEEKIPETVEDLREYDQVILNNISNQDLTDREIRLDELLYSYVYEYGGGMLTVGGSEPDSDPDNPKPHAYDRKDMYGSDYQKMLPVEAVNYTPPAGVFIIVDVSGSMSEMANGYSKLWWAKLGARASLNSLSERDKIGIMTLGSEYASILPLTPRTEDQKIRDAIESIEEAYSGTKYTDSVIYAAEQLKAAKMEKNHIIIVSDGEIGESEGKTCEKYAKQYYEDEKLRLTISIVLIGSSGGPVTKDIVCATREEGWIEKINANEAGCGYYPLDSSGSDELAVDSIATVMMQDLNVKSIKEINYQEFQPIVYNKLSQIVQGVEMNGGSLNVNLGGYFGVKKKNLESVDLVLTGEFQVPIYARWKYGKGSVGSFMCDLKGGEWSYDFMESPIGKQLIYNIIDDLMPVESIRPQPVTALLRSKNYGNHLTCPTALEEGESLRGMIYAADGSEISLNQAGEGEGYKVTRPLSEANQYSVCEFQIKKGGLYKIELQKLDADGNVLSSTTLFKEFSYSKEYDVEYELSQEEVKENLIAIAAQGGGAWLDEEGDVSLIFRDFQTELQKVFDPRLILVIFAVVLFLLDIAVRKFKFKWLHEIVRDRKEKKKKLTAKGGKG